MAIAFGSVGTIYEAFSDLTNSKSHTLTAGHELVVGVGWFAAVNIITATWNTSEALTAVGTPVAQGTRFCQMYALDGGTSGAHDVFIEFDGDPSICLILVGNYSGVATGVEFEGAASGNGNSDTPSMTVASMAASSFAIGFAINGGDSPMTGLTATNGTIRAKLSGVSGVGIALMDNTPTAGSAVMSGTLGAADNWAFSGAEFLEAAAGGGSILPLVGAGFDDMRGGFNDFRG